MTGWQSAVTALCLLTGHVFDAQHHPAKAVKVYLQAAGKTEVLSVQTGSDGVYRFSVTAGGYTIHAEGEKNESVNVMAEKVTLDLTLQPQFFDEPAFTVAGVTDNTYRGGHGADTVLRSAEALAKSTAALGDPHHSLAEDYEHSGRALDAVDEDQRAAELDPSETNLFDWGTELLRHGASQPAAEVFGKGVRLFPHSARMTLGLASAYYAAGSYEKSKEWFFKAVDLDPNDPEPYAFLSKVQRREITEDPGYQERLARFAGLQPENAWANYYYAVSLCNQHNYDAARPLLLKAVRLDPHLGDAYLQLGVIAQNRREAMGDFQKAIEANPDLVEGYYRLSEAYRVSGDAEKAKQEMAIFQRLSKESNERIERERAEMQRFVIGLPGH